MKKMRNIIWSACILATVCFSSCDNYLDVVPDNIATIDNAFTSRTMAEKFLFTCYSYMPAHADYGSQSFLIGDEFWVLYPQQAARFSSDLFEWMARGNQNTNEPRMNYWDGRYGGKPMFQGLRDCNIFLERIGDVPGMIDQERNTWIAEVKFLKAYYHYWLLRMYGPIPLIKENIPVSASVEEVQVRRELVDVCFEYVVSLLDEAIKHLHLELPRKAIEMGRATQPIALAVKAKVLVEAASPLFNGNTDYALFKNADGENYFNQTEDIKKWERAAQACKNAIDTCHLAGFRLYEFSAGLGETLSPAMVTHMSIRNSVAEDNYNNNTEAVWTNPNSTSYALQQLTTGFLDPSAAGNLGIYATFAPPIRIAEMFHTSRGIPIDEDEQWEQSGTYAERFEIQTATADDKLFIAEGEQTAVLHFDREPRFYANIAFDRGLWYGIGKTKENDQWILRNRAGELGGKRSTMNYPVTGYLCKKLANYKNVMQPGDGAGYAVVDYQWPVIRIADLYLLYAEAMNEAYGPSDEVYEYIDLVRERAGLEGVVDSWSRYAKASRKAKPLSQEGLQDIIHRERLIELANEGQRYWDIRRWKLAKEMWHNKPIRGWDIEQSDAATYYRVRILFTPTFTTKDYLWPIKYSNISVNPKLDQNPGW